MKNYWKHFQKEFTTKEKWLIVLHKFHGITAVLGGLSLLSGKTDIPLIWLSQTGFDNYYFPGVILFAAVGGSALIASTALYKKLVGAPLASLVAGFIMVFWIVGEVASIQQFHFLQAIYLITGITVIALTPKK